MNIDDAIENLKRFKRLGAEHVLIARDFISGGEPELGYYTPKDAPSEYQVVWINQVEDEYTKYYTASAEELSEINQVLAASGSSSRGTKGVREALEELARWKAGL